MNESKEFLTALDFLVAPIVAAIIFVIAIQIRNRFYPIGHPWRPFFLPALSVKLIGAISIGLIYAYYYEGGDTFNYHYHAGVINSALNESIGKWINLLFSIPPKGVGEYYEYTSKMYWYDSGSTYTVSAITAFLSAPLGNLYLPTALLFAAIGFSGLWALFRTFSKIYPALTSKIATATLFIPSLALWGSGIFKDTISLFALGWLTYAIIQILTYKNFSSQNLILAATTFLISASIKMYIIIAILPPVIFWATAQRIKKIQNSRTRILVGVVTFILLLEIFGVLFSNSNEIAGDFSVEALAKTSATTRGWIYYISNVQEGSSYDLGEFEPSLQGMFSKFPQAVNVTLFRPYVWEVKKFIVFLSALESLILLYLTIKTLLSIKTSRIIITIFNDPTIQFCLFFSIVFAFSVGISSYNFGSLSRYKIPCIPFYLLSLILIYYQNKPLKNPLLKLLRL